jgi:cell division protein ZapA
MSSEQWSDITLSVLNHNFQIRSVSKDVPYLEQAAESIEREIRQIHKEGKILGPDRIAIMAALRLTFRYLSDQAAHDVNIQDSQKSDEQIQALIGKIKKTIA